MTDSPIEPQPDAAGPGPAEQSTAPPSAEVLKAALKAFRKRLKLTELDDASRIGRGPLSSGQRSSVAAITPPDQYPRLVWEELVKQGKLKRATHGMYSLVQ
jgi:hypothetical protein